VTLLIERRHKEVRPFDAFECGSPVIAPGHRVAQLPGEPLQVGGPKEELHRLGVQPGEDLLSDVVED